MIPAKRFDEEIFPVGMWCEVVEAGVLIFAVLKLLDEMVFIALLILTEVVRPGSLRSQVHVRVDTCSRHPVSISDTAVVKGGLSRVLGPTMEVHLPLDNKEAWVEYAVHTPSTEVSW